MIYEYPKTAATQFVCESPDATEQEAIAFALEQFPECEYSRAEFLYEWRRVKRQRCRVSNLGSPRVLNAAGRQVTTQRTAATRTRKAMGYSTWTRTR